MHQILRQLALGHVEVQDLEREKANVLLGNPLTQAERPKLLPGAS